MKIIFITLCITSHLSASTLCFEDWLDQELNVTECEIDEMIQQEEESFFYYFYLQGRCQALEDMKERLNEDF